MDAELESWVNSITQWNVDNAHDHEGPVNVAAVESEARQIQADVKAGIEHALNHPGHTRNIQLHDEWSLSDTILCKNCKEALEKRYPGWDWNVVMDQGLVRLLSVWLPDPPGMGMVIHPENIDNDYALVQKYGGQMLEAHGMPRGPFKESYLDRQQFTFAGDIIVDLPVGEKC